MESWPPSTTPRAKQWQRPDYPKTDDTKTSLSEIEISDIRSRPMTESKSDHSIKIKTKTSLSEIDISEIRSRPSLRPWTRASQRPDHSRPKPRPALPPRLRSHNSKRAKTETILIVNFLRTCIVQLKHGWLYLADFADRRVQTTNLSFHLLALRPWLHHVNTPSILSTNNPHRLALTFLHLPSLYWSKH